MFHDYFRVGRITTVYVLAVLSISGAQAAGKRAWGDLDAFRLKIVSDVQYSSAAGRLAFVVSETSVAENTRYSRIWVLATGSNPVAVTEEKSSASSPRWSPDGKHIAYFA